MAKSNIIKDLAKGNVDVETALKELKLLLLSFPNEKLQHWVNKELSGYSKDDEVPDRFYLKPETIEKLLQHKQRNKANGNGFGAKFHQGGGR